MRVVSSFTAGALAIASMSVALDISPASAADGTCTTTGTTRTCVFASTGAEQTLTLPAGVTSVQVTAIGGAGGSSNTSAGGQAASVSGALTGLAGGSTLYVEVAGSGAQGSDSNAGGFNGGGSGPGGAGGGGGGASDVRTSPRAVANSLTTRLVVAAGGGGAGGIFGAKGGAVGQPGGTGDGGDGGGAATTTAGGSSGGSNAQAGSLGAGGNGADIGSLGGGGGGGGGLYGGGGGGGGGGQGGGGGGGGSSLVPANGSTELSSAAPSVTIAYSTVPAPPTPAPSTPTAPGAPGALGLTTAPVPHLRGHKMSIDVTGFTPGETYKVKISGVVVGRGTADAKGEIHRKVRVPLRAHRPKAKLVVKGNQHRVDKPIRIRDGVARP